MNRENESGFNETEFRKEQIKQAARTLFRTLTETGMLKTFLEKSHHGSKRPPADYCQIGFTFKRYGINQPAGVAIQPFIEDKEGSGAVALKTYRVAKDNTEEEKAAELIWSKISTEDRRRIVELALEEMIERAEASIPSLKKEVPLDEEERKDLQFAIEIEEKQLTRLRKVQEDFKKPHRGKLFIAKGVAELCFQS